MSESNTTVATEEELVTRAQSALSSCNWVIGECAAQWTERYGKGRTDSDFGSMIGLSGDQVFQRRRVWETFADVQNDYSDLKWSHFYVAINWDDASECLQWANEMEATIAEMKAWRRAQNGEDLTEPASEEMTYDIAPDYLSVGAGMVRDPDEFEATEGGGSTTALMAPDSARPETAASAAREAGADYAPFGAGARGPVSNEDKPEKEAPTAQQIIERATKMLEKVNESISPSVIEDFSDVPLELQQRFVNAIETLTAKTAGIS